MPPSAADGGSDDECYDGDEAEYRCGGLPSTRPLLLLGGELLLSVETLLLLGDLLFSGDSSLSFFSGVAEQCVGPWRDDDEREHGEGDGDDEMFHG